MADHRNSWEKMLPADSVQTPALDGGPLEHLVRIEVSTTSGTPPPPESCAYLREALAAALAGQPAADAFGFVPPPGKSNKTPLALLLQSRIARAVTLLIPGTAENANQATEAVRAVANGQAAPPSPEADRALQELRRLGGVLPTSASAVRVHVVRVFKKP